MQYSTLVRKKDNGYQYIISYKVNGIWKQKSKQGFKKSQDAKTAMGKMLEHLKETIVEDIDPSMQELTFKDFTDLFLSHLRIHREKNTIMTFETVISHCKPIHDKEVTKITNMDIQDIIDSMIESGLSISTIKMYFSKIKTIFYAAIKPYKLIKETPATDIRIPKKKVIKDKRALSASELDQLLKDFSRTKYYLIFLIAGKCGLRIGEILGLTWKDLDFDRNIISVNKQWKRVGKSKLEYDFGELKSLNSAREVPMSKKTAAILKKHRNLFDQNARLFPKYRNTDSADVCLNRILKRKGYDISIHELRHTYATLLIESGTDFKAAAKLLGHDVAQTIRTYLRVNDDTLKKANEVIENIF